VSRRLSPRAALGIAAGLAAFTATAVLAFTRNGGADSTALPLAPLATLGDLRQPPKGARFGPEGVPVPTGPALAPPQPLAIGTQVDGITCQVGEQVLFHIHAHLTIFVRGRPRAVPAGIGIGPPLSIDETPVGAFVAGGSCFAWLHTHSADGIIHTESPVNRTYTLGDFFDVWDQPLNRDRVGPARGIVTSLFEGRVFTGSPRDIPLLAHAQIQLDVGRPLVAPQGIGFPRGL